MSKKRWCLFIFIIIITNVATFKLALYIEYLHDYVYLLNLKPEEKEPFEDIPKEFSGNSKEPFYFKEESRIYVAVSFPDYLVSGDEDEMIKKAEAFIFSKDTKAFRYIRVEERFRHHTYAFHPIIKIKK